MLEGEERLPALGADRQRERDLLILVVVMIWAVVFVIIEGRGTTYVSDEQLVLSSTTNLDPHTLLYPLHGSLMAIPRFVFYVVPSVFGADSYWLLRLIGYAGVLACAWFVYVYARRGVGSTLALAPAISLLTLGTAWDVVLIPLDGIFWAWATAMGIAALLVLERNERVGDALAAALLLAAVACGSIGVAFVGGAIVYIAVGRRWVRAWILIPSLAGFASWWLWARQFHQSPLSSTNILGAPDYAEQSLGAAWAAITGLNVSVGNRGGLGVHPPFDYGWTPLLAAMAGAGLGFRLWLRSIPRSFWGSLGALIVYWLTSALAASASLLRTPEASRYVFGAVALVLLLTVDTLRGLRRPRGVLVAVFLALALALPANVLHLVDGRAYLAPQATQIKAQLRMLELAGKHADPTFVPAFATPDVSPSELVISARAYLQTVDRVGSWSDSTDEVLEQDDATRRGADVVLARALGLALTPGARVAARNCERISPGTGGSGDVVLPSGGARLTTAAGAQDVQLRRFADTFAVDLGPIAREVPTLLSIPTDNAPRPWIASIQSTTPVEVCSLRRSANAP